MIKIVQCWDDGVEDDIRLIEILGKYSAKASFNLNPNSHRAVRQGGFSSKYQKRIQRLARNELEGVYDGFTIANHSLSHPHPTQIDAEAWQREVMEARSILQDWFQQPIEGFVFPYGQYDSGTVEIVQESGHLYARTTGKQTPCFPPIDPIQFHPDCHFLAVDFWDRFQKAISSGCGVFYFWGHSFELSTEDQWQDFDNKIARLASHPDTCWADLPDLFKTGS